MAGLPYGQPAGGYGETTTFQPQDRAADRYDSDSGVDICQMLHTGVTPQSSDTHTLGQRAFLSTDTSDPTMCQAACLNRASMMYMSVLQCARRIRHRARLRACLPGDLAQASHHRHGACTTASLRCCTRCSAAAWTRAARTRPRLLLGASLSLSPAASLSLTASLCPNAVAS